MLFVLGLWPKQVVAFLEDAKYDKANTSRFPKIGDMEFLCFGLFRATFGSILFVMGTMLLSTTPRQPSAWVTLIFTGQNFWWKKLKFFFAILITFKNTMDQQALCTTVFIHPFNPPHNIFLIVICNKLNIIEIKTHLL